MEDLHIDYVNEKIELLGELEEHEEGISYCPYCGYGNSLKGGGSLYKDGDENIVECFECAHEYLERIIIDVKYYTATRRI